MSYQLLSGIRKSPLSQTSSLETGAASLLNSGLDDSNNPGVSGESNQPTVMRLVKKRDDKHDGKVEERSTLNNNRNNF